MSEALDLLRALGRRLLNAHLEWIDEVERELTASADNDSASGNRRRSQRSGAK